jgi:hypothetical protein
MSSKEEKLALARKASAQRLARTATEAISDRKLRALAKADVYSHVLPVLDAHYGAQQRLHRIYRRLLALTCGALAIALLSAVYLGHEAFTRNV